MSNNPRPASADQLRPATGWLNNGMPLSKASQLAGHTSVKVTGDIYGTSDDPELDETHARYTWLES